MTQKYLLLESARSKNSFSNGKLIKMNYNVWHTTGIMFVTKKFLNIDTYGKKLKYKF